MLVINYLNFYDGPNTKLIYTRCFAEKNTDPTNILTKIIYELNINRCSCSTYLPVASLYSESSFTAASVLQLCVVVLKQPIFTISYGLEIFEFFFPSVF